MHHTKKIIFGTIVSLGLATTLMAEGTNQLSDEKSRVSYAIGMMLGHNWQQQDLEVDPDIAAQAMKDVQSGGKTLMTQEEMQSTLTTFQKEFAAKQQKKRAEEAVKNKADGEAFLAANKNKPGVVTTPSGLQYLVLKEGTGPKPALTDMVRVHYHGTLIDGRVFDSSVQRGQPIELAVNGVIPGWTEALQMMPVGSKWRLFIPSNLAYGDQQAGPMIAPGSTLIFEVELLDIVKPKTNEPADSTAKPQ